MNAIYSLRFVLPLCIAVLISLAVYFSYELSRSEIYAEIVNKVANKQRDELMFAQGAIQLLLKKEQKEEIKQLITSFSTRPDVEEFVVVNNFGEVLVSGRYEHIGEQWLTLGINYDERRLRKVQDEQTLDVYLSEDGRFSDSMSSLCVFSQGRLLRNNACGFIFYRLNVNYYSTIELQILQRQALYIIVGVFIGSLLFIAFIEAAVTRRIRRLVSGLIRFNEGDRHVRVESSGQDELRWLSDNLNYLLTTVAHNETQLKEKEQGLEALFNSIIDSFIVIDSIGQIKRVNRAAQQMFGYTQDELLSMNVKELMPTKTRLQHDQYLAAYMATGIRRNAGAGRQVEARRKNGDVFPVELTVNDIEIQGEKHFTGVLRDVSYRQVMEDKLRDAYDKLSLLNADLQLSAMTDGLTGVANRRHFDSVLKRELARATRDKRALSVLLCDIDYFKKYNDYYGHQGGDACLQAVAKIMAETFKRASDVVARYGGEEFVIILPDTNADKAQQAALKLIENIHHKRIEHERSEVAPYVTLSIGCSTYVPQTTKTPDMEELIKMADEALYLAKGQGRNQACGGGELS